MSRLTQPQRERLRHQLMQALVPRDRETICRLEHTAFRAAITDYFTPAGLRRLAALPPEWFNEVSIFYVRPEGAKNLKSIYGPAMRLPRTPPEKYEYSPATQAAINAWYTHIQEIEAQERRIGYRIDTVLAASTTLEAVLAKIPEARGILELPPAADVAASADEINTALAARKATAAAAAPAEQPPKVRKPAKTKRAKANATA